MGYSGFDGKVGGQSHRFGSGVYKFSPDAKELEYLSTTSNNTWGLGFSEDFDVFISTANNTHSGFLGMPKRYFDKAKINETGVEKIDSHYPMHVATKNLRQVDVHGGFTAAAGHSLYTARTYPKEYWNKVAFVTEPTGRLIHKVLLEPKGSGFKEYGDGWNMLVSADEWAAPVQAEVGPDGALWIADWYDFIIQHNPTPSLQSSGLEAKNGEGNAYINPLRDHDRGRIYRLAYKENDQKSSLQLNSNDSPGLIKALSNKNMFWRTTAQRLLVEKGDLTVLPALYKLVQNEALDETGINAPAIHALWTLHGLHAFEGNNKEALEVATRALNHPAAGVRKAAIEVLPKTAATFNAMKKAKVFEDKDFRVRLAAVLGTTDMKTSPEIGITLLEMAEKEENVMDTWLKQALIIAGKINEESFKAAFKKRGLNANPSIMEASMAQRLAFGSRLIEMPLRRTYNREQQQKEAFSPEVKNKEILISGEIDGYDNTLSKGLVMAQGDQSNGYGLFIQDNKLSFQVNQNGKSYTLTSGPVASKISFKAGIDRNGKMQLFIDNKEVGPAKTPGLFARDIEVPVRVGMEIEKGSKKISSYPDTAFNLRGNLKVKLETLEGTLITPKVVVKIDKVITLTVLQNVMKYDKELITAKAGTTIKIVLKNPDFMQHNLVIIKKGTLEKVGAAADRLAQEGDGAKLNYVPRIPEVLQATPLIDPNGSFTMIFKVPEVPGNYPYVCTFPGHWRIMSGILKVIK